MVRVKTSPNGRVSVWRTESGYGGYEFFVHVDGVPVGRFTDETNALVSASNHPEWRSQ